MSDDLATQSLGINKLSLWEKRQQYEAWLANGRKLPNPAMITPPDRVRVDDLPNTASLRKNADLVTPTLNHLPAGAVVRTDDEPGTPNAKDTSDEVRLGFAKTLLTKAEGADAATAERIANAANALLGPMVARADDDADLKNKVLEPKKALDEEEEKPRKVQDDNEEKDKNEPSLADVMVALGKLNKRMDTIEAKRNDNGEEEEDDSGSEDIPTRGAPGPEGSPKQLAADDAEYGSDALRSRTRIERMDKEIHNWKNQDRFAAFQARADQISQLFGKSASPPIAGETLGAYKRRTVHEWQKFSPAFKNSDLKVLQVADGVAFNVAIEDILARADKEGRNPSQIPAGYLAERSEVKGGHTFTKFYGRPSTWMSQFAPQGKRVRRIIERSDGGVNRTLYERN